MHTKTITLDSGGSLTLSGEFDWFKLSPPDKAFIDGMLEHLDEYEDSEATR